MSDALGAVARDLAVLGGRDRRAILQALDADERALVRAAMRGGAPVSAPLARHSSWVERLAADAASGGDGAMTGAARAALIDALDRSKAAPARPSGRSLLQAAGGLFGQAIAR